MKKSYLSLGLIIICLLLISGCLSVEKKVYTFTFTGNNSGTLAIKYYNIMSVMDDGEDVSEADFDELLQDYINGDKAAEEYPDATLVEKKFFEEDGVLCAELVFEFTELSQARLYQFKKKGPYMYCLNCYLETESFEESNGTYGGEVMPVVFWEDKNKVLDLTTRVAGAEDQYISLLDRYKDWKAGQ